MFFVDYLIIMIYLMIKIKFSKFFEDRMLSNVVVVPSIIFFLPKFLRIAMIPSIIFSYFGFIE